MFHILIIKIIQSLVQVNKITFYDKFGATNCLKLVKININKHEVVE